MAIPLFTHEGGASTTTETEYEFDSSPPATDGVVVRGLLYTADVGRPSFTKYPVCRTRNHQYWVPATQFAAEGA